MNWKSKKLESLSCSLFNKEVTCYAYPSVKHKMLKCDPLYGYPACSEPETYDYFSGSGATYILSFLFLFFYIIGK